MPRKPRKPRRRAPATNAKSGRKIGRALAQPIYPTLADYLAVSGDTQVRVAKAVGTSQAYISRIAAGEFCPRPGLARRLASYCRIPLDSFSLVALIRKRVEQRPRPGLEDR